MNTSRPLIAALVLALLTACPAAVEEPIPGADASLDSEGNDSTDAPSTSDVKQPDPDVAPDVAATPDADPPDVPPDPCGICCPGDRVCTGSTASGICNEDGQSVTPMPCGAEEVCTEGVCGPPPFSCTPGASTCLDAMTLETCNGRGDAVTTRSCPAGLCVGGACVTGDPTGSACAADGDCAGGECLCKGGESCTGGVASTWAEGYCTTADCAASGCSGGESCVDFSVSAIATSGSHCIQDCLSCNNLPGYSCLEMPVQQGARRVWEPVCFPTGLKDFGLFCTAGSECRGGTCLRGEGWPANGYCTADCSADAECPSDARCVAMDDGAYRCAALCGDGRPGTGGCPEGLGLDVLCKNKDPLGGGAVVWVCAPR